MICIELLTILITIDDNIKRIKIQDQELNTSLFADDTESIMGIFRITKVFTKYAGLRLSINKSVLIYIGQWRQEVRSNMFGIQMGGL